MKPSPLYTIENLRSPAYQLRYTWCAWPSSGVFPSCPGESFFAELEERWQGDGIRALEYSWHPGKIPITFSATPKVSPVFLAARAKGRLSYALRTGGLPTQFSRKVAVRSVGNNTRADVEAYIERQVNKEQFIDKRFSEKMQQVAVVNRDVNLQDPTVTKSGRYWYDLHLVLIVEGRARINDIGSLIAVRDCFLRVAAVYKYGISRFAIVPDHLHASLRGDISQSPEDIALKVLNNLAYALGQKAVWEPCYYVGTFGEYDMGAVRQAL